MREGSLGSGRWMGVWLVGLTLGLVSGVGQVKGDEADRGLARPNVILFFIDDLGYGDIGAFGAQGYATPALDQMAREGRRFTDFVVASAVCSASRAALMTGCIHERVGIQGALGPDAKMGIGDHELTMGEMFREQGYATAIFGKWHLGHREAFLPTRHGFDRYVGLPYSNDMWPLHPEYVKLAPEVAKRKAGYPPLPMFENETIIDAEVTGEDQKGLTKRYTEEAIRFMESHAAEPFFVYLPHSMVHVPLFASAEFEGRSGVGLFADVMQEVDWSVEQILATVKRLGLDERTVIVFTSDNGPWLSYGDHAGNAGPLREGKGTAWEGGVRVPTVMRWPGKIPAGSECSRLASTIDLLPTFGGWIGATMPSHPIDGKDISGLIFGESEAASPHESFPYYYSPHELRAVRDERWKLVLPHRSRTLAGRSGGKDGVPVNYENEEVALSLFDLDEDVGERRDVLEAHPEIVARLQVQVEHWRAELGDSLTKRVGRGVRKAGQVESNP